MDDVISALSSPVVYIGIICIMLLFVFTRKVWGRTVKADLYFMRGTTGLVLFFFVLAIGVQLDLYHAADIPFN